ncbi:MAG: hypothetical protein WC947_02015 [Elusimicrobiota bacterium]
MPEKLITLTFSEKEQIEIRQIALDDDKNSALEFVKKLDKELQIRKNSHCGLMSDFVKQGDFDKREK